MSQIASSSLEDHAGAGATANVGYGQPPKKSRFKPGQSGNPKGRPPGAKNKPKALPTNKLEQLFVDEAYREIDTVENGERKSLPIVQIAMRQLMTKAAKGDLRAIKDMTQTLREIEDTKRLEHTEYVLNMLKIRCNMEKRYAEFRNAGLSTDDLFPNPDHIHLNVATGDIEMRGPLTKEENDAVNAVIAEIRKLRATPDLLADLINNEPQTRGKPSVAGLIKENLKKAKMLEDQLPQWAQKKIYIEENL